ncbi:hypothetical protein V1517DRAFT_319575 [Lipomyces orientalis]|uniref:Uncharacterized protein n=1 Tax=Lipomyces orientalis TaxID=1233043 RepID=A0ACC3TSG3_9ASCO
MAMLFLSMACTGAFTTFASFFYLHPSGSCRRKLKASEIFVKEPYSTESLLSDALSAKYKVSITTDSLVSSYSYQNSPYVPSILIGTRAPGHKITVLVFSTVTMLGYAVFGILVVLGHVNDKISFLTTSVFFVSASFWAVLALFVISATMKSSFKEDDAVCATVYFNTTDQNWVASSDSVLFNSSERMQIAIKWKWTKEVWFQILLALQLWTSVLSWTRQNRERLPGIMTMVSIVCSQIFSVAALVSNIRRSASSVEVQLAYPVKEKDADNAGAVEFDPRKVARAFADQIAREAWNSPKEWPNDAAVYSDFAISGKYGGLVYGRIRAKGTSTDV